MTRQKHLKRLVRSRAEKTGESYTAARSNVVARRSPNFPDDIRAASDRSRLARPGHLAESAALTTTLNALGVRASHTGAPLDEALLFGIAGGIGGAYWVFEYKGLGHPLFSLFTRHAWDSSRRFLEGACTRLKLAASFKETASSPAAERALLAALEAGRPVITWVSCTATADSYLPPEMAAMAPQVVTVHGFDRSDGRFEVADRAGMPFTMTCEEMARSRAAVKSEKQRLLVLEAPASGTFDLETLRAAVIGGIEACVRELVAAPAHLPAMVAPNSGLTGLEKLGRLLSDTKDKRGWAALFPAGLPLYVGLTGIFRHVELLGRGGALRPLFADFLEQASVLLDRPTLVSVATSYRSLGQAWSALAAAALPDTVPLLGETRAALARRRAAFASPGAGTADEVAALDARLAALKETARDHFPMDAPAVRALLDELSHSALTIVKQEREAVTALRAAR